MEVARLVEMLRRVHDGDAWHGPSVMAALEGVTAAEAIVRPIAGAHTIWEIVLHMVAWRREVTRRLGGKAPTLPEEGDWPEALGHDETHWTHARLALQQSHDALVAAVEALEDADLDREVGDTREPGVGAGVTIGVMLHGIVQHDCYHAGQLSLLRKAAGAKS